jgi:GT2 family glycosyltransferase
MSERKRGIFAIIQLMTLSVIILSFNTRDVTLECLSDLAVSANVLKSTLGIDTEVFVVDNASTDGSVAAISQGYPSIKLIVNKENVGFARGNNQAMEKATGEWILLLNSDAYLEEDSLVQLLAGAQQHSEWSLMGCQLMNADGTIQPSFGYFPNLLRVALLMFMVDNLPIVKSLVNSIHVRDLTRYELPREVDWVTGAFVLLKREVFAKVGGIDEKYFMYGEEAEWMYRCHLAGYKVGYWPGARCVHLGGASTKSSARMIEGEMKGYLYWFEKHNKPWQKKMLFWIIVAGCYFKFAAWKIVGHKEQSETSLAVAREIYKLKPK